MRLRKWCFGSRTCGRKDNRGKANLFRRRRHLRQFWRLRDVGEPLAVTERQGNYISTVWKAGRSGGSGAELCAIKCFARVSSGGGDQQQDTLGADTGLEFLETLSSSRKRTAMPGSAEPG